MKHRFVIGIGSQRAGSTLLHSLLADATDVFMHPVKELHYFDTLHGLRPKAALIDYSKRQMIREVERIINAKNFDYIDKRYRCYLRTNKLLAMAPIEKLSYLELFRPCLKESRVLGEVTPEYMRLDAAGVDSMRDVIGADAAIILICRNPVNRVLSAVKLMNTYNNMGLDDAAADAWLRRMMDENSTWMRAQDEYNDYQAAIDRFGGVFSRFLAISYDELITQPRDVARKLESVIDLPIDHAAFANGLKQQHNSLGDAPRFSAATLDLLTDRYAASQRYLAEHFAAPLNN